MAAEAAGLRKASESKNIEVDKDDQLMINSFNRLNNRKHELLELIKKQKEQLSNLEDAQTELMLLDDAETFMFAIGDEHVRHGNIDTFIHSDPEGTDEQIEALMDASNNKVAGFEAELAEKLTAMDGLKTQLYAKFGRSINLEE
eukprot:TRINITY_DN13265_c0_g1_i3.p2 TRINITY_DN13265_c0_g1~~TRINITY_DN13265_c0_g1_i3.p2  ORF type:complete len:144 (-),score=53.24 TRINITY_DN13265_c0_g1_i3:219-650(-)